MSAMDAEVIENIKTLLWGSTVKEDVFERWTQGFYFSSDETTALVQTEGGPCAVIAPVQAFILKRLFELEWNSLCFQANIEFWKDMVPCDRFLLSAIIDIVTQTLSNTDPQYHVVHLAESNSTPMTSQPSSETSDNNPLDEESSESNNEQQDQSTVTERTEISQFDAFHSRIRIFTTCTIVDVYQFLLERIDSLKSKYGVLLMLYTVICNKGVPTIQSEMSDPVEPMIDSTYGYGSQSLINLMLTGRAVSHVWDHDQDVGGLKLRGIDQQSHIGFLTLLEHLRYCEVGNFLKSPRFPIWVLGSETHLTVLFALDRRIVSAETAAEKGRRIFKQYDPEGKNFISANQLQIVLAKLGLFADKEYVGIMRRKLDSENLGIILLSSFMDEFFPEDTYRGPDTFTLYHYNGLPRSNPENKVVYHRGQAVQLECNVKSILDSNPMLTVLQTKWPRIEVQWDMGRTPSLN